MLKKLFLYMWPILICLIIDSISFAQMKVLVMPLKGQGGIRFRNVIVQSLEESLDVQIGSKRDMNSPAKAARRTSADVIITGQVNCKRTKCSVNITLLRPSGETWTSRRSKSTKAGLDNTIEGVVDELLNKIGAFSEQEEVEEESEESHESFPGVENNKRRHYEEEEEEQEEQGPSGDERYDALRAYLLVSIPINRDLQLSVVNPSALNRDRSYSGPGVYTSIGIQGEMFPGAFFTNSFISHLGVYFAYDHSLYGESIKDYKAQDTEEPFTVNIGTSQYDLMLGLVGRIPFLGYGGPEIRLYAGYGIYEFSLNESDYPQDSEISDDYDLTNPYLPTYTYSSIDFGFGFRYPFLLGGPYAITPGLKFLYRYGLSVGNADVFGKDTSSTGIDFKIGIDFDFDYGISISPDFEILWYSTTFGGDYDNYWTEGSDSTDLIVRAGLNLGWKY